MRSRPSKVVAVLALVVFGLAVSQTLASGAPLAATAAASGSALPDIPTSGPVVTSVSPDVGPVAGGTTVLISGTGFTGVSGVSFGTAPALTFAVSPVFPNPITATSPPGAAAGTVNVIVSAVTPGGIAMSPVTPADRFTYEGLPTVSSVSPAVGTGGTAVTVTGTNFVAPVSVYFGTTEAFGAVLESPTSISVSAPVGVGVVDVTVVALGVTSAVSSADQFTYEPRPGVTSVAPDVGGTAGGAPVTITGTDFIAPATVHFGSAPATGVTVISPTSITATSPPGAAGTADVTVTTVGGTSPVSPADQFTYSTVWGHVLSVGPNQGPTSGGTVVTITGGGGFAGATAVNFGANAASDVTVNSDTSISATSPAGAPGTVDVTVITPSGTSAVTSADHFTYLDVPAVLSVNPNVGPQPAGTPVTITGTNFVPGATVDFGANAASDVTVNSATSISALSPAGVGTVDVTVTTPGGTSPMVSADQFTYAGGGTVCPAGGLVGQPMVTGVAPLSGPNSGGTQITITGSGFCGVTGVFFGSTRARTDTVISDTSISATSPAEPPGTVDVVVSASGGTSPTSSADRFTFVSASPPTPPPPTPHATYGYWLVGADGGIFNFGSAQFYGSTGSMHLQRPVVGMAPSADHHGYLMVAADGGMFAFGDAGYHGSIPGLGIAPAGSGAPHSLAAPIVAMVASPTGNGYLLVASDGGVFAFGDARFRGSCPQIGGCDGSVVAVVPDSGELGYWVVTSTGHVYPFGDAKPLGQLRSMGPPTAAVADASGHGYFVVDGTGKVEGFGDATTYGTPPGGIGPSNPIVGIVTTSTGDGYWIMGAAGALYWYGDAPNDGSMAGHHLNAPIVTAAGF